MGQARSLIADFDSVPTIPKFTMRPSLTNSQTFDMRPLFEQQGGVQRLQVSSLPPNTSKLSLGARLSREIGPPPPEGTLQVVEMEDLVSSSGSVHTDGSGYISADLTALIPQVSSGLLVTPSEHNP